MNAPGMLASSNDKGEAKDVVYWEYSMRAVTAFAEYKNAYPILFEKLGSTQFAVKYSVTTLLGAEGNKKAEEIHRWIEEQPFAKIPRTPFSTYSMSKDAMKAVERAADVRMSTLASNPPDKLVVKNVPVNDLYYADSFSSYDAPLAYNCDDDAGTNLIKPKLGDRVVNLNSQGVPFGLRGTVITIHENTGFVEVLFDEEFTGGKSLQGSCSQFRGRLVPWSGLLFVPPNIVTSTASSGGTGENAKKEKKKELTEKQKVLLKKVVKAEAKEEISAAAKAETLQKVLSITSKRKEAAAAVLALKDLEVSSGFSKEIQPDLTQEEVSNYLAKLKTKLKIFSPPQAEATTVHSHAEISSEALPPPPQRPLTKKEKKQQELISLLVKVHEHLQFNFNIFFDVVSFKE